MTLHKGVHFDTRLARSNWWCTAGMALGLALASATACPGRTPASRSTRGAAGSNEEPILPPSGYLDLSSPVDQLTRHFAERAPYFDVHLRGESLWYAHVRGSAEVLGGYPNDIVLGRLQPNGEARELYRLHQPCRPFAPVAPGIQVSDGVALVTWWCSAWWVPDQLPSVNGHLVDANYPSVGTWTFAWQRLAVDHEAEAVVLMDEPRFVEVNPELPCGPAVVVDPEGGLRTYVLLHAGSNPEVFELQPESGQPGNLARPTGMIAEAFRASLPEGCWNQPMHEWHPRVDPGREPYPTWSVNASWRPPHESFDPNSCWRLFPIHSSPLFERACHLEVFYRGDGVQVAHLSVAEGLRHPRLRMVWAEVDGRWTLTAGSLRDPEGETGWTGSVVYAALQEAYEKSPASAEVDTALKAAAGSTPTPKRGTIRLPEIAREGAVQWQWEAFEPRGSAGESQVPNERGGGSFRISLDGTNLAFSGEVSEWIGRGWFAVCTRLAAWRGEAQNPEHALCHLTMGSRAAFFVRDDQLVRPLVWNGEPFVVVGSPSGAIRLDRLAWCMEETCDAPLVK